MHDDLVYNIPNCKFGMLQYLLYILAYNLLGSIIIIMAHKKKAELEPQNSHDVLVYGGVAYLVRFPYLLQAQE